MAHNKELSDPAGMLSALGSCGKQAGIQSIQHLAE